MDKLAAGERTLAEIESSVNFMFPQIIKLNCCLWFHFTCAGLWAELDVRWLCEAADLTWSFNHDLKGQFIQINESVQCRNRKSIKQCPPSPCFKNFDLRCTPPLSEQSFSAAKSSVLLAAAEWNRC